MEGEGEEVQEGESGGLEYTPKYLTLRFDLETVKERKLTLEEAGKCLNTLGKDESGVRYAYLMMSAVDMQLTDISTVVEFNHLLFVDVSGNFLNVDALQVVARIPYLLYLKAERNPTVDSGCLKVMHYLQVLLLNNNRITETADIAQPMLEVLELGGNLIYTVQFISDRLPNVKEISLHDNHLMDMSGTYPSSLEKLYLNRNKISKIRIDSLMLPQLKVLHLRDNNIRKLDGFSEHLPHLEYLNVRNNKIGKIRQFRKLKSLPRLQTLIISGNPLYRRRKRSATKSDNESEPETTFRSEPEESEPGTVLNDDPYRSHLLVLLPGLTRINKETVAFQEREEAEIRRKRLMDEIFEEDSSEDETEAQTTTDITTDYTTDTEVDEEDESEG